MDVVAGLRARNPLRAAGFVGQKPVEGGGHLDRQKWPPPPWSGRIKEEWSVERRHLRRPHPEHHVDTRIAQEIETAASGTGGIRDRGDHPSHAGGGQGFTTRRSLPVVGARLEGHDTRRAGGIVTFVEGVGFSVRPTVLRVVPLTDDVAVTKQHGAHEGIRRDPAPPAQGELYRTAHRFELGHDLLLNIEYPIMNIE
jgi:hypothetical protein